ncbi:MAG: imidazolonepropionase, partial [Candidatus Eisenbacteria bacterium]|nr:imidazolonepropionase [Candidatus Eisenbacteria bacterium]
MRDVSLLVLGARQLLTIPPPPGGGAKRGAAQQADLGLIADGALAIDGGRIAGAGTTADIRARFRLRSGGVEIDAAECVVLPAFVDPHTHVLFHGTREWEFERRLQGSTYMEIAAEGGGIRASVRMFR